MSISTEKTQQQLLAMAIRIAAEVHERQLDKGGKAYVLHPLRVMFRLRTEDAELMQIAVLHDVIEDAGPELQRYVTQLENLSQRVLDALDALTHQSDESYVDYIARIARNRDAIQIKIEDLRDNTDVTRLKGLRPKDHERMQKYHEAYIFLTNALKGT